MAITLVVGLIIIFSYLLAVPPAVKNVATTLIDWATIVIALATGLGVIFLLRHHVRKIIRRETYEWIYSLIIVISVFILPLLAITSGTNSTLYQAYYNTVISKIGVAVYGIVIFSLSAAAYRAFRVRTLNGLVLMLSGILVMLQIAPIGGVIWSGFPLIGNWIMSVPNKGGFRGIMIAAGFGLLALAFRTIFGYERGYLGTGEE
ncbi:MAG: hypothetical protein KKB59_18580 [Spirochaetes bacterium]|nr:hypothetical protein [Spirochaetota bacterium]